MILNVISVMSPLITGGPALVEADSAGQAIIKLYNCGPDTVELPRKEPIATMENAETFDIEWMSPEVINAITEQIGSKEAHVEITTVKRELIRKNADIDNVPPEFQERYLDLMCKYHMILSEDKNDIGRSNLIPHEIHLKNNMHTILVPRPLNLRAGKIPTQLCHHIFDLLM
jgi:hypothetical protein